MVLNHLSLPVADVAAATAFFEKFFGFKCTAVKGDNIVSILNGENNFLLVLTKLKKDEQSEYPADFHIGFMLQTTQEVIGKYNELKEGGVAVQDEPRKIRETLSFYFYAPGNILIEVGSPL